MRKRCTELDVKQAFEDGLNAAQEEREEAVAQAFKDGLNRAAEHIAAMPEPVVYRLPVNITSSKLYYARRGALRKGREVFGSGYRLEIDSKIGMLVSGQHAPVTFTITVIATKKEQHA
jgi:hypothetical protein